MPTPNVWTIACGGSPWTDLEYLTRDVGEVVRDMTLAVMNSNPYVKHKATERNIRSRVPAPKVRPKHKADPQKTRRDAERREMDALATRIFAKKQ